MKFLICILSVLIMTIGCSKLGGGGSAVTIVGNAMLGPVHNAEIKAYAINASTGVLDTSTSLAITTTNANGEYTLSIPEANLPSSAVGIRMSGGSYTEESSGLIVTLSTSKTYTTLIPTLSSGNSVTAAVGPLPDMAYKSFKFAVQSGLSTTIDQAIRDANSRVAQAFGLSDVVGVLPTNPFSTLTNDESGKYAIIMAGISKTAQAANTDSTAIAEAYANAFEQGSSLANVGNGATSVTNATGETVSIVAPTMSNLNTTVNNIGNGTTQLSGVTPPINFTAPVMTTTVSTTTATPNPGITQWVKTVSVDTANASKFEGTTSDSSGNSYAVGSITGNVTFSFGNNITVTPTGAYNLNTYGVIVKYNSSGVAQWAKVVSPSGSNNTDRSYFYSAAIDSSGNVYAVGFIQGAADFGNSVTVTGAYSSNSNIVIVKYNSDGLAQWAKTTTAASDYSYFNKIAIDSSGNIYAAGTSKGSDTFGFGNSVTAIATVSGGNNSLIVKYNSSGVTQWASTSSASTNQIFKGVAVNSSGIYAVGSTSSNASVDFGNSVTVAGSFNGTNPIIVKYNDAGVAQWAKSVTTSSAASYFNKIAIDSSGNLYATGVIYNTIAFDLGNSISVTAENTGTNSVLVKYNSSGIAQWAKSSAGVGYDVAIDSSSNVYVAGLFTITTSNFGNSVSLTGRDSYNNPFLVKYNSSGNAQWAKGATGTGADSLSFLGLNINSLGSINVIGAINGGTMDFGNSINAAGASSVNHAVIVKY